jgi:hypothetical protein
MEMVMNMVVEMQWFPLSSDKMDVTSAGDSLWLSICGGSVMILTLVPLQKLLGLT